jgi:hypothetical protein
MLKTVFFLPLDIVRPQNLCEAPAIEFQGSIFSAAGNILFNCMVLKLRSHLTMILQIKKRKEKQIISNICPHFILTRS